MGRVACVVVGLLTLASCGRHAYTSDVPVTEVPSAGVGAAPTAKSNIAAPPSAAPHQTKAVQAQGPRVERTIEGNFRGRGRPGHVLFLDNSEIVQTWDENGTERREPVTTRPPPGTRQCKALRSLKSQDFLLCMYWFTGPGGGRVDGVLFDLARRQRGEFFSAAINIQLLSTLCYPKTMVGPMPSFTLVKWATRAATTNTDAEVLVTVRGEGWSTRQAASLRALPATKKFCKCVGNDKCAGAPKPPVKTTTIVYRLARGRLHPTAGSRKVLREIAAQWNHSAFLKAWNLTMRGY